MHYLQVSLLHRYVVQKYGSDKNTYGCQEVNYKDEFQELPGTPYRFKNFPR